LDQRIQRPCDFAFCCVVSLVLCVSRFMIPNSPSPHPYNQGVVLARPTALDPRGAASSRPRGSCWAGSRPRPPVQTLGLWRGRQKLLRKPTVRLRTNNAAAAVDDTELIQRGEGLLRGDGANSQSLRSSPLTLISKDMDWTRQASDCKVFWRDSEIC